MDSLPMVPAWCSLDGAGWSVQRARYAAAGEGATVIERDRQRIVVHVGERVSDTLLDELVTIEGSCCPFFELNWLPQRRQLAASVVRPEDEPALEALIYALGLDGRNVAPPGRRREHR
jgi:hypothetical protein